MIKEPGIIQFEVEDVTRKHTEQSVWKKTAMVMLSGDICQYYAWFLKKRYRIILNKPLRGPHISFINDRFSEMNHAQATEEENILIWEQVKQNHDGKEIIVTLSIEPRSNGKHWWLNIPEEYRSELQGIRNELGLDRPFSGLHLSLGYCASEKNILHSQYIHKLLTRPMGFDTGL